MALSWGEDFLVNGVKHGRGVNGLVVEAGQKLGHNQADERTILQ